MIYDPKSYYPGGWKVVDGERKKQIYGWEPILASEVEDYELVAIRMEDNGWFAIDLDDTTDEAAAFIQDTGLAATGTRKVRTQSGGFHWYFQQPSGEPVPRMIRAVPGLDIIGTGMLFCPPSDGWALAEGDDVLEAPTALIKQIRQFATTQHDKTESSHEYTTGSRNNDLFLIGVAIRKKYLIEQRDLESILIRENQTRCRPPLNDIEVMQIAASVVKHVEPDASHTDDGETRLPMEGFPALRARAQTLATAEQFIGPFISGTWGIIAAPPGVGKSVFSMALAMHLAKGEAFLDWPVPKPRRVLMIDAEMSPREINARAEMFMPWPDTIKSHTLDLADRENCDYFSLGEPRSQGGLMRGARKAEIVIVDNIEYTLDPIKPGEIHSPETWKQVHPLTHWAKQHNKLLILIDHTNAAGNVQGSLSKQRGADFVISLEPEFEHDPHFTLSFRKCRYLIDKELRQSREFWIQDGTWHSQLKKTTKDMVKELAAEGMTNKEISEELGVSTMTVSRHRRT